MIRRALESDLDGIMVCIEDARLRLKESGSKQWNAPDGYPRRIDLYNDIMNANCYINIKNDVIAGVVVYEGKEPEYDNPYGNWLTNGDNYLTIHRLATRTSFQNAGIAKELMEYAEVYAKETKRDSIRIDTHPKNLAVQHLALTLNYTLCGYVFYSRIQEEAKRLIYEKIIK